MGKLISILYSETFKILKIFQLWLFLLSEMELQQVSSSSSKITASFLPADVPDFSAAGGYDILCPHKFPLDGPMKNSRAEIVSKLGNRWIGGIYHKKKPMSGDIPRKYGLKNIKMIQHLHFRILKFKLIHSLLSTNPLRLDPWIP